MKHELISICDSSHDMEAAYIKKKWKDRSVHTKWKVEAS